MTNNIDILNTSFNDLWKDYHNYLKVRCKPNSLKKYENDFRIHLLPFFKDYLIKDITTPVYLEWMSLVEDRNYKWTYKKTLYIEMVGILNYACKFYDLPFNIASKIGNFKRKQDDLKNVDFWTYEEFKQFISVIDNKVYKTFFETLYFTGLRLGECLALNWNDFDNGYLYVNKTLLKMKDKNNDYIFNSPKTLKSNRKVKLDNELIKSIIELYVIQKKDKNFSSNWFIFGGKKPLSQTTCGRRKNQYCDIAKVKKIRLHDFRHSHATLLLSKGVPITVISQRLGHSDISMTLNTYSHLINKDEDKAVDIINLIKS